MYSSPSISVLTIVHKRHDALMNLMNGLAKSSILPIELIIVYINERAYPLKHEYPFTIKALEIDTAGGLNLAEARNTAIKVRVLYLISF